jgi:hypothetical protein
MRSGSVAITTSTRAITSGAVAITKAGHAVQSHQEALTSDRRASTRLDLDLFLDFVAATVRER